MFHGMGAGGMKADIFSSMAEGVSGSACLVCFMTQAYQDSKNCALELKFVRSRLFVSVRLELSFGVRAVVQCSTSVLVR